MQGECQDIVATLPVSHQIQIFGTARQQAVQVALPMYFISGKPIFLNYLSLKRSTVSIPELLAMEWRCLLNPMNIPIPFAYVSSSDLYRDITQLIKAYSQLAKNALDISRLLMTRGSPAVHMTCGLPPQQLTICVYVTERQAWQK